MRSVCNLAWTPLRFDNKKYFSIRIVCPVLKDKPGIEVSTNENSSVLMDLVAYMHVY